MAVLGATRPHQGMRCLQQATQCTRHGGSSSQNTMSFIKTYVGIKNGSYSMRAALFRAKKHAAESKVIRASHIIAFTCQWLLQVHLKRLRSALISADAECRTSLRLLAGRDAIHDSRS